MTAHSLQIPLPSPDVTAALAAEIGQHLTAGDCLLLEGAIGAGKTHFARSLIQSQMPVPEDVPSPTFTLIQTYDLPQAELWHADLYRLSSLDEIEELGLTSALETAICLIEWPDKLAELTPPSALHISLELDQDALEGRFATLRWTDPRWTSLMQQIAKS
ncbi:ADP-binding protein [Phaeobacter italicus]|jgi:tRNA threonylcarbamoyladenosine biosynthesis protein TsaE|uniref:tRNA threonylcarbamoyladenosine biosynthesis protein TsaE n=1 Tax=Phaeobacter italicus TaxID=481446 RepID=A0A0H5D7J2_9RHOB|nr:tRNA (adenosine(37)-N6)-threonylcarbamoyltransferase complex ATPase subunit type 1 TsaE [Phaeobacter italicus]CRL12668.1 ADP-binding protein [Phaeobacter italicus]